VLCIYLKSLLNRLKTTYFCLMFRSSRKLNVGDPQSPDTFTGALISKEHLAKVRGYVEVARKEGANIVCGEEPLNLPDRNRNVRVEKM